MILFVSSKRILQKNVLNNTHFGLFRYFEVSLCLFWHHSPESGCQTFKVLHKQTYRQCYLCFSEVFLTVFVCCWKDFGINIDSTHCTAQGQLVLFHLIVPGYLRSSSNSSTITPPAIAWGCSGGLTFPNAALIITTEKLLDLYNPGHETLKTYTWLRPVRTELGQTVFTVSTERRGENANGTQTVSVLNKKSNCGLSVYALIKQMDQSMFHFSIKK